MSNLSNIRRAHIGPWRKGTLVKPSKVRRCINVTVRSATTLAVKTALCPQSDLFEAETEQATDIGKTNAIR
jgi:hypothetical protein